MILWKPYLWKECRQNLRMGLSALILFLGFTYVPWIIDLAFSGENKCDGNALALLVLGGPILAVMAGVRAMGREQGRVGYFWRAQPVNLNGWLVSKYVVGLLLVCLACWLPLGTAVLCRSREWGYHDATDTAMFSLVYSFLVLLIYSTSLALGVCMRSVLHAAILAIGAVALIFLVPLVVAPLSWLSVYVLWTAGNGTLNTHPYLAFAGGMTALSIALLCFAGILLKRNIRVDVNQRTLCWATVVILLVLVAGIAFPMGTNIPVRQMISLPIGEKDTACELAADGNDVAALLMGDAGRKLGLVRMHVGERKSVVEKPIWFAADPNQQSLHPVFGVCGLARSAEEPSLAYVIIMRREWQDESVKEETRTLYTIALDSRLGDPVVHRVELNPMLGTRVASLTSAVREQRLFVFCSESPNARLLTFSLADPKAPSLLHNDVLASGIGWLVHPSSGRNEIKLISTPDLDDSSRLELTYRLANHGWVPAGDSRLLTLGGALDWRSFNTGLVLWKTGAVQDSAMPVHPVAQYRGTVLARLLGSVDGWLSYSDPLAYSLDRKGVTVYRIRDFNGIERIGYYAAYDEFATMAALPHNRVVLAGKRLHVLDLSGRLSH